MHVILELVLRPLSYAARRLRNGLAARRGSTRASTSRQAAPPGLFPHRRIAAGSAADTAFLRSALHARHDAGAAVSLDVGERARAAGSDSLRAAIERERLAPLMHQALGNLDGLPAGMKEMLRQSYRANGLRNIMLLRELEEILRRLVAASVPVIVLKGAALAEPIYGNVALRPMGDLDLLVHRRDVQAARGVLEDLDFRLGRLETHQGALAEHENELTFSRPGRVRVDIDLHWSLIDSPFYQERMAMDWFWASAREQPIGGTPALTLGLEALILHLCAHLTLHHGGTGLLWWNDIAEVLRAEREHIDWSELLERSRAYGMVLPVREVLTQLASEWKAPVPAEVLQRLAATPVTRQEAALFSQLGGAQSSGRRFWMDVASMPGWRQAFRFAWTNLLPSAAYMRQRYGIRHRLLLPFYYPYRWLRGLRGFVSAAKRAE